MTSSLWYLLKERQLQQNNKDTQKQKKNNKYGALSVLRQSPSALALVTTKSKQNHKF
jgi:hypothetical protein